MTGSKYKQPFDAAAALALPPAKRRGRPPTYPPEIAAARRTESGRRTSICQAQALHALSKLHLDEYQALYDEARRQVEAERGPLPTSVNGDKP